MSRQFKEGAAFLAFFILAFTFCPKASFANAAEPPSILIIVQNPPKDLEISIEGASAAPRILDKAVEKQYLFYYRDIKEVPYRALSISSNNEAFQIDLPETTQTYNNIFPLDLKTKSIIEGKSLKRSVLLVGARIALTLAIEASIFFAFGFKNKDSWLNFFIVNLATQGGLFCWLNTFTPTLAYPFLTLLAGESLVFVVEIASFLKLVSEHSRGRKITFVLSANLLSLVLGSYTMTALPI